MNKYIRIEDIEEVLPNIYRMTIPLPNNPLRELNSYVIKGIDGDAGSKSLLIDTGFRQDACKEALMEGLELLGIDVDRMDLLLTHLHADHTGNAPEIVRKGNSVYISRVDRNILDIDYNGGGTAKIHDERRSRLLRHGVDVDVVESMIKVAPSRLLAADGTFHDYVDIDEGDELSVGGYTLRAIYTNGHTPGHMCFDIVGTGAMILGDHVLFDITPNITDWYGVEDSLGDYLRSLDKIDKIEVTIPLPAHRKRGDYHKRIADIKQHHIDRLDECEDAIAKLGKAKLYDIAANMSWKIRSDNWEEFPLAQKWFALGECMSHIDRLVVLKRIRRCEVDGVIYYERM